MGMLYNKNLLTESRAPLLMGSDQSANKNIARLVEWGGGVVVVKAVAAGGVYQTIGLSDKLISGKKYRISFDFWTGEPLYLTWYLGLTSRTNATILIPHAGAGETSPANFSFVMEYKDSSPGWLGNGIPNILFGVTGMKVIGGNNFVYKNLKLEEDKGSNVYTPSVDELGLTIVNGVVVD